MPKADIAPAGVPMSYVVTFSSFRDRDDESQEQDATNFVEIDGNVLKLDGHAVALYSHQDNKWYILGSAANDPGWQHINVAATLPQKSHRDR